MKCIALVLLVFAVGCSSPTAPTPTTVVAVAPPVVAPPVVTPPIVTPPAPARNPLLDDPRFSLVFYRRFVLDGGSVPLNRRTEAPMVYLATTDLQGRTVDDVTIDRVSSGLIAGMSSWALPFGLAGIQRGAAAPSSGRIIVLFDGSPTADSCGITAFDNRTITLSYGRAGCLCSGRIRTRTVKHELGHALGFTHTGDAQDLMSGLSDSRCDQEPSARELFHKTVAYTQPNGSYDPQ